MWNYVDRQQKFKTYDHYINQFEMIWCREVKSTQNHSFKERYLGKFKKKGCFGNGHRYLLEFDTRETQIGKKN